MPEPSPSTKPVWQKLLFKPGQRAAVLNAPADYVRQLPAEAPVADTLDGSFDFIQTFATRREQLLRDGPAWRAALAPNGLLWVSYPKGKALATDLNRDVVRTTLQTVGLEVVSQVAIDELWSALRAKPA
jgi:hypothetical protein